MESWGKLKQDALRRARSRCCVCKERTNLHVHHIHYPAKNLKDVLVVCPPCHFQLHGKQWKKRNYTQWNKERLKKLIQEGKSLREIGNIFQVSHERIRQKLKEFRIETTKTNYELPMRTKQLRSRIMQFRQIKQLTQIELAKRIGCSYSSIARYEKGETMPLKIYLLRLCAVFYCQPGELFLYE